MVNINDQPPTGASPGHMTPDEFRVLGRQVIDMIADYWTSVEDRPVGPTVAPGQIAAMLPKSAPERPEEWGSIFADIERVIMPGLMHWQSPNFFGFFPANGSFPAVLGDLLSTGLGVQGMLWATSPAATEIEAVVLDWVAQAIGLPAEFCSTSLGGGVIQSTASEATLVALVAARAKLAEDQQARCVLYASSQAHSSVMKAGMIAGLAAGPEDHRRVRLIATDSHYAMDPAALSVAIQDDLAHGLVPACIVATVGTTSTTAIDPLGAIGPIARERNVWLHVDAAFSGSACICPELRGSHFSGIELADSVVFNPHKWLLTSFDCSCMFVRDRAAIIRALSITPEYLRNDASVAGRVIDYRDWQIPLGRRFRALKLWFVLRHYGLDNLRAYIREHVRIAAMLEGLVQEDARFEVIAPRTSSLVCMRLRDDDGSPADGAMTLTRKLVDAVNQTGRAYLTHTVLQIPAPDGPKRSVLRVAIGSTLTQERHVRDVWALIQRLADEICS